MSLEVTGGVETLTIQGASPDEHLLIERMEGADCRPVVTVVADEHGQAHVALLPEQPRLLATVEDIASCLAHGSTVPPGRYRVTATSSGDVVDGVQVLAVEDHPDPSLFDQELTEGFGYLTVRDGVTLSIMVRFPDRNLYGEGPWPTVIEYSGYGPSNPHLPQPGTLLAGLLGFATVGVNMRGTGCSGGVFDVFSPAQAADGYDVVETVARQPWVQHGHVGMVGLSYPGISQLYVAATQPPSLAAITPLSVIDDLWRQQWPGGIYNSGFTRAWLAQRDMEIQIGGQDWDKALIEEGDQVCELNQRIRSQNFDFERFGRAIENFRDHLDARRVADAVHKIQVPVYLTGAWQDEQTGSRFALMLKDFTAAPHVKFTLFNGHHPDGYSPMVIARWFEFLCFHVARRIPSVPELIRMFAPLQFAEVFGVNEDLEPDRFEHWGDDFDSAFAEYCAELPVRMLFESGTGTAVAGGTGHRYETATTEFPPPGVVAQSWWFASQGTLAQEPESVPGADCFVDDPEAGDQCYGPMDDLQAYTKPTVPIDWTRFEDRHRVAYETEPLVDPIVIAGQGHVECWLEPGSADVAVQATITEIRSDGVEQRIQCGWHRPVHRVEDPDRSDELLVDYTFTLEDRLELTPGELIRFRIPLMPFVHVFREGSRIRVALSSPGRDMPMWNFENPIAQDAVHRVVRGGEQGSRLVLPVWADGPVAPEYADPGALRGQPHRDAEPIRNTESVSSGGT